MCQKRSFLSQSTLGLKSLKNLVPQTLGKTAFDFGSFLASLKQAILGATCSIGHSGLNPAPPNTKKAPQMERLSVTLG